MTHWIQNLDTRTDMQQRSLSVEDKFTMDISLGKKTGLKYFIDGIIFQYCLLK